MTGDRTAHPLLISLANISADVRMKSSHNAFALLALLPIPKFLERKSMRGMLADRLAHACLDFILQPLKISAAVGIMMNDPLGYRRFCFTPCASYMVDTQEAVMLAGVCGKTSHLTVADYKKFGDSFRHEPRTASLTITQRHIIRTKASPSDLTAYLREAKKFRLNGVDSLFWRDWPGAEPSNFFTPEPLHHWHKYFWDHDAKWCIRAVGSDEIDFRFSILPHRVGFRQFREGISKLKQVTGREHRDVERYMVAVIAGAVPKDFLIAIRALMDFRYLAQAPIIDDTHCNKITNALLEFHAHKHAILEAEARVGKGNRPIDNWWIPKLEMMQSVVANIRANGAAYQWSADVSEHAHITEIKHPAKSGNNQNYESQICRSLDRTDKIRRFDLATSMLASGIDFGNSNLPDDQSDASDDSESDNEDGSPMLHRVTTTSSLLASVDPVSNLVGSTRHIPDYFEQAQRLVRGDHANAPRPFRTFSLGSNIAFHLSRDPSFKKMTVDQAAEMFLLPDLRPALADFFHRTKDGEDTSTLPIGGRRTALSNCPLPFDDLSIWKKVQVQLKEYHYPNKNTKPRTLMIAPPSDNNHVGQYDTVLVNTDPNQLWPRSGLEGAWFRVFTNHCLYPITHRSLCRATTPYNAN